MSIPDFERAQYVDAQPAAIEGEVVGVPLRHNSGAFPLALLYGAIAAAAGSLGYAVIWSFGFMVSIVAIGIGWLVARAMMTASGGVGGRPYQIGAAALTYFAVSCGSLLHPLWKAYQGGAPATLWVNPVVLKYVLAGPLMELQGGINGVLGLVILGIGMRAAWRLAAGSPGFGSARPGTRQANPFRLW